MRGDMFGGIAKRRVWHHSNLSDLLVMILHKFEMFDHRTKILPSWELGRFYNEARQPSRLIYKRIHCLRQLLEIDLLQRAVRLHMQHGMLSVQGVFNHLSVLLHFGDSTTGFF